MIRARVFHRRWLLLVSIALLAAPGAHAQTATTGTIVGTVADESGARLPGATVDVLDIATNTAQSVTTNDTGQYIVPNLRPGDYRVTVGMSGFRTVVTTVKVEVARSVLANATLAIGQVAETVEVKGQAKMDLQTLDASIGNVVGGEAMVRLPTIQRRASELLYLQVGAQPLFGGSTSRGGGVAGARSDQNVFTLDGIDISEPEMGGITGQIGPGMMVPIDAIEEFRATSTNANATFGRSGGGQFTFATRRGSNRLSGAGYWYFQDDALQANSWTRKRLSQPPPQLRDNRAGGRLGGPIVPNRTFFFGFYEGRRFPQSTDVVRLVPTDSFRQGFLRFRDGAGNIVSYDLRASTLCGPTSTSACDPRGVGMSPVVRELMTHYPTGNSPSDGDGLNTIGFRGPNDTSQNNDILLGRVDHNLSARWRLYGSVLWQRERIGNTAKVEFDPDITKGQAFLPLSSSPSDPRNVAVVLSGEIRPTMFNEARMGWAQTGVPLARALPRVQVASAGAPMDFAGGLLGEPGDPTGLGPQFSRSRVWQWADTLTWTMGQHAVQTGTTILRVNFKHRRNDKSGLLTTPFALIGSGSFFTASPLNRPPTCVGTQTNCLRAADVSRWDNLYAAMLGIIDNYSGFLSRNTKGEALPIGTPLENDVYAWHNEFYASDTWRVSESLTLNYGLNFILETPARDIDDRQAFLIDTTTGRPLQPKAYIDAKAEAARRGQTYNPLIGFVPTEGKNIYPTQRKPSPRLAATWQPSAKGGLLGRLFGDRQSVIRGGYSLVFDRLSIGRPVETPMTGNENFAQTITIQGPRNAAGDPYRVGVDGPIPALTIPPQLTFPFVPAPRNPAAGIGYPILTGRAFDPDYSIAHTHSVTATVQREIPGAMIAEAGWIGRHGRNLPASLNINPVPYFIADMSGRSSQTFADAFNAVAAELRSGVAAARVTPQAWFENNLGAGGTASLAAAATANFVSGQVATLFSNQIDPRLLALGRPPVTSLQFQQFNYLTFGGRSDYNAAFVSLAKRPTRGLTFNVNYTWAHYRDQGGLPQDSGGGRFTDSFDWNYDYGYALSDRRHSFTLYGTYELPFARQHPVLGGWYASFIALAYSGLPIAVSAGGQNFGFGGNENAPLLETQAYNGRKNYGITGSGGVASSGNPASGGTGVNMFDNPEGVFRNFRPVQIGVDKKTTRGLVRGLPIWNLDMSVGKTFMATRRTKVNFSVDFFNLLNTVMFADPGLSILDPAGWGVATRQTGSPTSGDFSGPRRVQLGLRVEY